MTGALQQHILVVDDSEASRLALVRTLRNAGFEVHEAATGEEALPLAAELNPELIVLDAKLPDISGQQLCRLLREHPATAHIPVLHVSAGYVRPEHLARGLEGGAGAYPSPTVERVVLVATASSLMRARRDEEALRESERRLEQKARELARSNDELEAFASIVSHDLRSPLVSIGGCVQLLTEEARDKLGPEGNELLDLIQESVAHMGAMIKNLLTYARIGAGGLKLTQCDLEAVLETVINTLKARLEETGGAVTHDPLPLIRADETMLTQLFANLVENSLKYHGAQPPRVHVSAQDEPRHWTFSVRDNGIGIEPQSQQKVFQMFQRVHSDESKYEGAGIGLASCKKIVERHGGSIWVDSKVGEGTTFYFTLPKLSE